jgi:hypothetical protein
MILNEAICEEIKKQIWADVRRRTMAEFTDYAGKRFVYYTVSYAKMKGVRVKSVDLFSKIKNV